MSRQPTDFKVEDARKGDPSTLIKDPPPENGHGPQPSAPPINFTAQEWAIIYNWLAGMTFQGNSQQLHDVLATHDTIVAKLVQHLKGLGVIPPEADKK